MLTDKLEKLFRKYSKWILSLEALVILAMLVFICRNRAVDWDEAYSVRMITKYSFAEMFQITAEDIHPPLYYVVLRLFSMIFGTSVFALKMVSVAFTGLVMLLGITKVCKYWGGYAAFFFNLAVGLGAQFTFYSVNIRMYSMSLFFVTWCALLAYELIRGEGGHNWVLFTLAALGGAYTHYFNVIPLAFICGYLLVGLLVTRKKDCKYFGGVCAGIILGYLPWLPIVFSSFQREGVSGQIDVAAGNLQELFAWAFATNIKFSEWTPLVMFAVAVILLPAEWKRICVQDRLFFGMCALNLVFSYVVCRIIASMNQHFWTERYVFAALGTFWLFLALCYSRKSRPAQAAMLVWLGITGLSAFTIVRARELETNVYMDETYRVLEQVRGEELLLYNYDTYDVLYGAHLREQEFVFIDDFNWEEYEKDYIYLISWGGHMFDEETEQRYGLELYDCGDLRFEEGVAGVKLYKVCRNDVK